MIQVMSLLIIALIGSIYAGVGWCVAWILDAGLGLNVNYTMFVAVSIGFYALKLLIITLGALVVRKEEKKSDEQFEKRRNDMRSEFDRDREIMRKRFDDLRGRSRGK